MLPMSRGSMATATSSAAVTAANAEVSCPSGPAACSSVSAATCPLGSKPGSVTGTRNVTLLGSSCGSGYQVVKAVRVSDSDGCALAAAASLLSLTASP